MLGAQAANTLQIQNVTGHIQVFLGGTWFNVIGVMKPVLLDPSLDSTAFIGLPVAERLFQTQPNASEIYVRANVDQVDPGLEPARADRGPAEPDGVQVSRPSDALEARAAAKGQFTTLLLGLGAVALLVGAIGIANIMVISVLERRGEIGLRRALGATRRHIRSQFLTESALLAALGGIAGLLLGALATWVYSLAQNQPMVVPAVCADRGARRRAGDRRDRRAVPGGEGGAAQPDRSVARGLRRALAKSGRPFYGELTRSAIGSVHVERAPGLEGVGRRDQAFPAPS